MGMQQLWWSPSSVTANPQLCWLLPLNKGNPSLIKTDSWKFIFTLISSIFVFHLSLSRLWSKLCSELDTWHQTKSYLFDVLFCALLLWKINIIIGKNLANLKIKKLNWTTTAPKFQAINKCWYLHFSLS